MRPPFCQLSLTTRFSGAGWVTVGAVLSTSAFSFTVVKRYGTALPQSIPLFMQRSVI